VQKLRRYLLLWLIIVLVIVGIITYAPSFLLYSSSYQKADSIVLLLGPDFTARQKEAYKVIEEGMADYLIIPAYQKIYKINDEGTIKYLSPNLLSRKESRKKTVNSPCFYEDTHIEIIDAAKIMSDYGLKSAIFISSPYHMRRINMIVSKIFDVKKSDLYFVPTSFEKAPYKFWELSWADWRKVGREYGKMFWFSLYGPWTK
jgi:hypothetical protein